jgi:hypothetical protein
VEPVGRLPIDPNAPGVWDLGEGDPDELDWDPETGQWVIEYLDADVDPERNN